VSSTDRPDASSHLPQPDPNSNDVSNANETSAAGHSNDTAGVLDLSVADQRIPGGREGFVEIAQLFITEADRLYGVIATAIADSDAKHLQLNAHTLKGAAKVFGAQFLVDAAFALEHRGERGNLSDVEPLLARLRHEIDRAQTALRATLD